MKKQALVTTIPVPNIFCLVKGAGEGQMPLNAFDNALLAAGIGDTNIVRMSSIIPPGAQEKAMIDLPKGGLIPAAYAHIDSGLAGEIISAAIAVALPEDTSQAGVIMEYEAKAPLHVVEQVVRQMAEDAFARRKRKIREIKTAGVEHTVKKFGAVFAGAVLWYE